MSNNYCTAFHNRQSNIHPHITAWLASEEVKKGAWSVICVFCVNNQVQNLEWITSLLQFFSLSYYYNTHIHTTMVAEKPCKALTCSLGESRASVSCTRTLKKSSWDSTMPLPPTYSQLISGMIWLPSNAYLDLTWWFCFNCKNWAVLQINLDNNISWLP